MKESKSRKSCVSKVKKRRIIKRVPTGIPNFDRLIEGGFEENSINLVVGDSGSGKTIFATHFLMNAINENENCLYITFEEKKEEFYNNMLNFGWDLEAMEERGRFIFLEYTPEKVKTMLEEGGGTIESIVLRKKISRIVIDSITSFALLFEDDLKKREAALELFNMLRKWGCTCLLTYEEEPSDGDKSQSKTIEFESDSIIAIYFLRAGKERRRYIEILKMRGTKHSREIYPFDLNKSGIIVSKEPYEGKI